MGLFVRSNGYYYAEITVNGKRIQKSLKTKSKVFAQDLYHVLLREKILKDFFSESNPTNHINTNSKVSIKQDKKRIRSTIPIIEKYMQNCKSRNLGNRAVEDKKRTFKLLREYKLMSFEDYSTKKIDALW
ncbi:MAG: hypothetical protein ATN36_03805 [Epulopiscium sp. Nele67-Bin005]|nr:MAG: hypothetical protein ATN36_03805 [Epulopiscium sp. Nele67-Bin005]